MLVPILMICGVIVVLALTPTVWLVAFIVALELGALAVGYGLAGMLNETASGDADDNPRGERQTGCAMGAFTRSARSTRRQE